MFVCPRSKILRSKKNVDVSFCQILNEYFHAVNCAFDLMEAGDSRKMLQVRRCQGVLKV